MKIIYGFKMYKSNNVTLNKFFDSFLTKIITPNINLALVRKNCTFAL